MPLSTLFLAGALLTAAPTEPWAPPAGAERAALLAKHERVEGEPGWTRASGGAYVVRTDAGPGFALDAACFLERFRSQMRSILRDAAAESFPPLVVICKDEARYRKAVGGGRSRGMYMPNLKTLYTYVDPARGEKDFASFYAKILLHEGAHQLLHAQLGGTPPLWFGEGLAAWFQEWDVRAPVAANLERLPAAHFRIKDVREALGTERWVPLRTLLSLDARGFDPDDFGPRTNLNYAEAASFIAYLASDVDRRKLLSRCYQAIRDGDALDNVLRKGVVEALEKEWPAWIRATGS